MRWGAAVAFLPRRRRGERVEHRLRRAAGRRLERRRLRATARAALGLGGFARQPLHVGVEGVDALGLVGVQPIEVATTTVEITLEKRSAAEDRREEGEGAPKVGNQARHGQRECGGAGARQPADMRLHPCGGAGTRLRASAQAGEPGVLCLERDAEPDARRSQKNGDDDQLGLPLEGPQRAQRQRWRAAGAGGVEHEILEAADRVAADAEAGEAALDAGPVRPGIGVDRAPRGFVEHRLDEARATRAGIVEAAALDIEPAPSLVELVVGLAQGDVRVACDMSDLAGEVGIGAAQTGVQPRRQRRRRVTDEGRRIHRRDVDARHERRVGRGLGGLRQGPHTLQRASEREALAAAGNTEHADRQRRAGAAVERQLGEAAEGRFEPESVGWIRIGPEQGRRRRRRRRDDRGPGGRVLDRRRHVPGRRRHGGLRPTPRRDGTDQVTKADVRHEHLVRCRRPRRRCGGAAMALRM